MKKPKYPFGAGSTATLSATGDQAITIDNEFTVIDGVTNVATGNRTLNLTVDGELKAGARLLVKSKTTATETTVMGTGIDGPDIVGVAGKTKTQSFTYDGSVFLPDGTSVQID